MTSSNMALRLLHRRRGKKGKAIRVVAFETRIGEIGRGEDDNDRVPRIIAD
ncbi:hypothetical protein F2Q68_00042359 [Brassica cretica]|uniref:Uncharacterized protein n=1 Tax=Brassica cretica TaxID=69181 RepID=A0A8S9MCM4_BRACR|nr:hypothetical protein F2Q68_00042360 [Brassica cretica]KAF2619475.1 hypothetical protein F2Q68_00042359 [Brassica cretica]